MFLNRNAKKCVCCEYSIGTLHYASWPAKNEKSPTTLVEKSKPRVILPTIDIDLALDTAVTY